MRFRHQLFPSIIALIGNMHMPAMPAIPILPAPGGPAPRSNRIRTGRRYRPNGERECARRLRQIAAGQIHVTGETK